MSNRDETDSTTTRHLDQEALAKRWGISPKTLERYRVLGIGPVYVRLPGRVLYRIEDIEAYEERSLRQATGEPACRKHGS